MLVVGISGSPRKAGNTEFLLGEALAVAKERGFETERLNCSELRVDFCTDCGDCSKGRPCPKEDDAAQILEALQRADGIIVASPVYFGSVTAQLKAVFDVISGNPAEFTLTMNGDALVRQVVGDGLQDWSVRQETNGTKVLVLRPKKSEKTPETLKVDITAEQSLSNLANSNQTIAVFTVAPSQAGLFNGYVRVMSSAQLDVQPAENNLTAPGPIPAGKLVGPFGESEMNRDSDCLRRRVGQPERYLIGSRHHRRWNRNLRNELHNSSREPSSRIKSLSSQGNFIMVQSIG